MFSTAAFAIRSREGKYLCITRDKFGLDISHEDTPQCALIWGGRAEAEDLLFHAEQQLGEECVIVEFELKEKS